MNDYNDDSINTQIERLLVIKAIDYCRKTNKKTNDFLNTCMYCISRCLLQDILSIQNKYKYQNKIIIEFCNKYKLDRDIHSHFYETTKNSNHFLNIKQIEEIIKLLYKEMSKQNGKNISCVDFGDYKSLGILLGELLKF